MPGNGLSSVIIGFRLQRAIMQNLDDLSLAELVALEAEARALLARRREARSRSLRQEMERMARTAGLSAEEFALLAD
jgi:hypothetical protein